MKLTKVIGMLCIIYLSFVQHASASTGLEILVGGNLVIDRALKRTEETGDHLLGAFSSETRKLIDYLETKYVENLSLTLEEMDSKQREIFKNLERTINLASEHLDNGNSDVQLILNQVNLIASQIPGARRGFVTRYEPNFFLPPHVRKKGEFKIKLFGNGFSDLVEGVTCGVVSSNAECASKVNSDGQIEVLISDLEENEYRNLIKYQEVNVDFSIAKKGYEFFGKDKKFSYSLPFYVLPNNPYTVTLFPVFEKKYLRVNPSHITLEVFKKKW